MPASNERRTASLSLGSDGVERESLPFPFASDVIELRHDVSGASESWTAGGADEDKQVSIMAIQTETKSNHCNRFTA